MHENHPHPRPNIITVRIPDQAGDAVSRAVRETTTMPIMPWSESPADVLKFDYSTSLMEFSHGPIKTSMQMMKDAITAYTDITTRLPDVGIASVVQQAFNVGDAFKSDYANMFARLSSLHIQPVQDALRAHAVTVAGEISAIARTIHADIPRSLPSIRHISPALSFNPYVDECDAKVVRPGKGIWLSAASTQERERRKRCLQILRTFNPDFEEAFLGVYDAFYYQPKDFKRQTLTSLRGVLEYAIKYKYAIYDHPKPFNDDEIIKFLRQERVTEQEFISKCAQLTMRGRITFWMLHQTYCHVLYSPERVLKCYKALNDLHKLNIPLTEHELTELITEVEHLIIHVISHWFLFHTPRQKYY